MGLSCSASLEQLAVDLEHRMRKWFFMECCKHLPSVFSLWGQGNKKGQAVSSLAVWGTVPKVATGLLLLGLFFWRMCELIKHVPYQCGHNAGTCDNHDHEEKNILNLGTFQGRFCLPALCQRSWKHCWCSGLAGAETLMFESYAGYTRKNTWVQRSSIQLLRKPGPYSCWMMVKMGCLELQGIPFPCCFCVLHSSTCCVFCRKLPQLLQNTGELSVEVWESEHVSVAAGCPHAGMEVYEVLTRACLESCICAQYSQPVPSVGITWVGS